MQLFMIINALEHASPALAARFAADLQAFSASLATTALTALWQGAAVACGLAICLCLAPRLTAAHRFAVWAASFMALLTLPFLPSFQHVSVGVSASAESLPARPLLQLDPRWTLVIAALWLLASTLRAADLAVHAVRLRKLWQAAVPIAPGDVVTPALLASAALRARGPVEICTTHSLERPSAIGFFAPRILIPDWLLQKLSPAELEQIVLHETEHLRRRDDWTNLLQKLCLVLFPLNPALWWIERRLCQEREMACDDGVVSATQAPRAYAACLASLAERSLQRRSEALSLGAWHRRPELARRVHRILRREHTLNPVATYILLGLLACGVLGATVELAHCPQWIAFVPAQANTLSATAIPAVAASPSANLVRTSYAQALQAENIKYRFKNPAERLVPKSPRLAPPTFAQASPQPTALIAEAETANPVSASAVHSMNAVKAINVTDRQPSSSAQPQWVVFTAWEQVQTTTQDAQSDPETSVSAATGQSGQQNREVTSKITVTRLIFKVLPASSLSTQPPAVPTRDGWIVIRQL
jgi:beta-lactamase regulating signal transducer with metallopeptidase domain